MGRDDTGLQLKSHLDELNECKKRLRLAEEQLMLSQEQNKNLLESLDEEVHYWKLIRDKYGKIKTWELVNASSSTLKVWGKTIDEVRGRTTNDIFGFDATSQFLPIINKIFASGKPHRWVEYFKPTGQYLSMSSSPVGEYFISTGRDITKDKLAEIKLKASEEKFRSLFKNSSAAIVLADDDGIFIEANQKVCELLEYSLEELSTFSLIDLIISEDQDLIKVNKPLKNIKFDGRELKLRAKNGEIKIVEITSKGFDKDLNLCTLIDITERKRTENELVKSQVQFKNIADNIPGIVLRFKLYPDGRDEIVHISKGINRIHEISQEEALNDSRAIWNNIHEDDITTVMNSVKESADKLSIWSQDFRIKLSDGRIKWLYMSGVPMKASDGSIIWDSYAIDISKQKEAELKLEELNLNLERRVEDRTRELLNISKQLELYWLAAEHAQSGVWRFDIQNNTLEWDDIMYKLYGINKKDFSGAYQAWESSLHPSDKTRVVTELQNAIEQNEVFDTLFRVIHPKTGKVSHIRAKGKVEFNDEGMPAIIYGTNWDVTLEMELADEREKALNNLKEAQSKLIQSEKMASLGVLTAGVAHEINNPLNYILGGHTAIYQHIQENDKIDKDEISLYLEWIKTGAERATGIVKSLNLFNRTTDGLNEQCSIHDLLDNCLLILQNKHRDRIEIAKAYMSEPARVKGNNGRLSQAILNLISNAIDAIDGKGKISITTKAEQHYIKIVIKDNGHGIATDNLDKILDPFFTTKHPGEGTGLGLSISKSIIDEHKGRLSFNSEQNKGTTFVIELPKTTDNG